LIHFRTAEEEFMAHDHSAGRDTYRLIVTRRNASEFLLRSDGTAWSLPSVEIPQGRRIAEHLGAELYAQWGYRGYCLLATAVATGLPRCAVMEVAESDEVAPAGSCWKPRHIATSLPIEPLDDRTLLKKSIEELSSCCRKPHGTPFAMPGWLSELLAWAEQQLEPFGVNLTGAFTQLNASPAFSLIRLETSGSAVWFKATGEPNRRELAITTCLTRLFPGYLPELLGVNAAWNGWLMREACGRTLDDCTGLASWRRTAKHLARLQIGSIGKQNELLEAGCLDLRLAKLIDKVDPFVDRMRQLMAAQEKLMPARLTETELVCLRSDLKEACLRLSELRLPDTLGHLDFNPGNIVVSPEGCVFLDWAEACITSPLLTLEHLREHFRRSCSRDTRTMNSLAAAYVRAWQQYFSTDTLQKAMVISPLVAVFAYAAGSNLWWLPEPRLPPSAAGYFRSLTRRMYRETIAIAKRRVPCLA
jgi:hypothetical protein